LRGAQAPTRKELAIAALTGILMAGAGNGAVIWAEQVVPSGITAVIVATVPLWIVLMDWVRPSGRRPRAAVFLGVALGLAGIVFLIGPRAIIGQGHVDATGAGVLMFVSVCWALGSIVTRHSERPRSALVFTAMQMLAAGAGFFVMA